jgi:hypothetical protein
MPDDSTLDIRSLIAGSDQDDDIIQAVYNSVNRLIALVGDVPFRELFESPIRDVAASALASLERVATGLIKDPASLRELIQQLVRIGGEATLGELFSDSRQTADPQVLTQLIAIRRAGLRIPIPARHDGKAEQRRLALADLVKLVPKLTFRQMFTRPKKDVSNEVLNAIGRVKTLGLLSWFANDRCCIKGAGHDGVADKCSFHKDLWCNLTGMDGDLCSIASDLCPKPADGDETDAEAELKTQFVVSLPGGAKALIGLESSHDHTLVHHYVERTGVARGETTVTCTCWVNGVPYTTTKTCSAGSSPLCDCTHPKTPKITC